MPFSAALVFGLLGCRPTSRAATPSSGPGMTDEAPNVHAKTKAPPAPRVSIWSTLLLSGGGHPAANAIAHERNIAFVIRALGSLGLPPEDRTLLFADGDDEGLDLQLEETDRARFRRLYALGLARGVDDAREATLRYRDHELGTSLRADLDGVQHAFLDDAKRAQARLSAPPPLLVYVTDHGLEERDRTNNTILLWNDQRLSVRQLGGLLDAQPPARRVVTVMAQCFSGSFAGIVHRGGNPRAPLAQHDRCGFFAAPKDRPAAGCSPRADESLYDDYTTRFFAALSGSTRTKQPAPDADLDGDGAVSLEEAHYAAVILEDTMDVPITTSEDLLRRERAHWLSALDREGTSIASLLAVARPTLAHVGRALAARLGIRTSWSVAQLDVAIEEADRGCLPGFCEALQDAKDLRRTVHQKLRTAPPFPLPTTRPDLTLALVGGERIDGWIAQRAPELDRLLAVEGDVARLRAASESLEGRQLRLLRVLELIWLERVLRGEKDGLGAAYDRLRACETSRLDQPRPESGPM